MDRLPRLGKRELICLLLFTCNYVVPVWRGFLFLWVLGMGYVILLWHSLSLPYNYFVTLLQICEKQHFTLLTLILSMMMCIQNLVLFCQFVLKILSKNQILTSIKGHNSVASLRKTKIYNTNLDSTVLVPIWPNFKLVRDVKDVLITCKYEEDPIKNRGARVFTRLYINFSDALGQSRRWLLVEIRSHPSFHVCPCYLQE